MSDLLTAETITDEMIEAIRDAACECRPRPEIESDDHAAQHDCDVIIYDQCVVALEAVDEEAYTARYNCALMANAVLANDGPHSAYWRALVLLVNKRLSDAELDIIEKRADEADASGIRAFHPWLRRAVEEIRDSRAKLAAYERVVEAAKAWRASGERLPHWEKFSHDETLLRALLEAEDK